MRDERHPVETKTAAALSRLPADFFDAKVVLAYSGGPDSSALLSLLAPVCPHLCAYHLHHGIRGEEADRDADFCVSECARLGIPLTVSHRDIPAEAASAHLSVEEAARNARYEELFALADGGYVVTAHQANDRAETLLFRLCRGAGAKGLSSLSFFDERRKLVRPMLDCTKDEILDYCEKRGIAYVTDATNEDETYARNHIRKSVIPALGERFDVIPAICRSADSLAEDEEYLQSEAAKYLLRDDACALSSLASLPDALLSRVLVALYEQATGRVQNGLTREHLLAMREKIRHPETGARLSLPGKTVFEVLSDRIRFVPDGERKYADYDVSVGEGENVLCEGVTLSMIKNSPDVRIPDTSSLLAYGKIKGAIRARPRRAGDLIRTAGMHKDVRKLLSASHLPETERSVFPVLYDDAGILCLPGIAVRDDAKVRPGDDFFIIHLSTLI